MGRVTTAVYKGVHEDSEPPRNALKQAQQFLGHGHRIVRGVLRSVPPALKPSAAEPLARKGVCGRDAGPKPTGTSSRRPLRPGVGCPKGKGHQTAEMMTTPVFKTASEKLMALPKIPT